MEVTVQPKLMFHGVDFVNIKLDTVKQYDNRAEIDLNVKPKVFYPENEPNLFRIFMEISIICEGYFEMNLVGIGNFEFDNGDLKKTFVNTNAPAIMFPYVRSFITTLTSNLGDVTGSLVIPTQFFQGDLPEFTTENKE